MISFACFSPHPPILLPEVGSKEDRALARKTIESLTSLGEKIKEIKPDEIIISSPHADWGFNVPLHFLARHSLGEGGLAPDSKIRVTPILVELEGPGFYFEAGRKLYQTKLSKNEKTKFALIASGDVSHCLKRQGPYGFQPDGPRFDESLVKYLKEKEIEKILNLDEEYPQAGECGLRSFAFLLGILEASKKPWRAKILSYEGPWGVGYLVVQFDLSP